MVCSVYYAQVRLSALTTLQRRVGRLWDRVVGPVVTGPSSRMPRGHINRVARRVRVLVGRRRVKFVRHPAGGHVGSVRGSPILGFSQGCGLEKVQCAGFVVLLHVHIPPLMQEFNPVAENIRRDKGFLQRS